MTSHLLFIGGMLMAIIFIAWLVYRNLKDEKKFERELDERDMGGNHGHKDVLEGIDEFDGK